MEYLNGTRRQWLQAAGVGAVTAANTLSPSSGFAKVLPGNVARPKVEVLAHRGASALRPEHTLASYAKAIADGADYIEPDLVMTKDGVLVARHDNELSSTTNVAEHPEFSNRRRTEIIDGEQMTGWFVSDFTYREIKTLRARERIPEIRVNNAKFDGQFEIPSWEEIIDFVAAQSATVGRQIGLVPELKHSSYFANIGLSLEDSFLAIVNDHSHTRTAPLIVQSFEVSNLINLRKKIQNSSNIRLMQLTGAPKQRPADFVLAKKETTFGDMTSKVGLQIVRTYADIVAPPTRVLVPVDSGQRMLAPSRIISDAHDVGLVVHTWTFRPENRFLAANFRNLDGENARNETGSIKEMQFFIALGIDGFFTDDSVLGRRAVDEV